MNNQNLPHHPAQFEHVYFPVRHRPAEWCPLQRKWFQDGRELRKVKASKAFVWPKDGRTNTSWGRFKDILHNKGPDMYLTINASEHDYMWNRPSKARWTELSSWRDHVYGPTALSSKKHAPWTHKSGLGGRISGLEYDFRTREYGVPNWASWTGAVWQPYPRKNKHNPYPEAYRDVNGDWFQDRHYAPWHRKGPLHNEQGRGNPLHHPLGPFGPSHFH
jgi:hypothetical protein